MKNEDRIAQLRTVLVKLRMATVALQKTPRNQAAIEGVRAAIETYEKDLAEAKRRGKGGGGRPRAVYCYLAIYRWLELCRLSGRSEAEHVGRTEFLKRTKLIHDEMHSEAGRNILKRFKLDDRVRGQQPPTLPDLRKFIADEVNGKPYFETLFSAVFNAEYIPFPEIEFTAREGMEVKPPV